MDYIPKTEQLRNNHNGWLTFVRLKWGTVVCREAIQTFMFDDQGVLDIKTMNEVSELADAHDDQFPELSPRKPFTF